MMTQESIYKVPVLVDFKITLEGNMFTIETFMLF